MLLVLNWNRRSRLTGCAVVKRHQCFRRRRSRRRSRRRRRRSLGRGRSRGQVSSWGDRNIDSEEWEQELN